MLSSSLRAEFHVGSTEKGLRRLRDFGKRGVTRRGRRTDAPGIDLEFPHFISISNQNGEEMEKG